MGNQSQLRVVVVGAGIMGACLAFHLARGGAAVTILDQGNPADGATGNAFGWINIADGAFGAYSPLRQQAAEDWRQLECCLATALKVRWCGALRWDSDTGATERFVANRIREGYHVQLIGRDEIAALEPSIIDPPDCAAHMRVEGVVDPREITKSLIREAALAGARLVTGCRVTALQISATSVTGVITDQAAIGADMVVLAAGIGAQELCRPFLTKTLVWGSPAILLHFRTGRPLVKGIISAPGLEVRQGQVRPGDPPLLIGAADYIDESDADGPVQIAARFHHAVRARLRGGGETVLEKVIVGIRPMPTGRTPIVGQLPGVTGLYLALAHAGVTMAPAIGRLAAADILNGGSSLSLDVCRPARQTWSAENHPLPMFQNHSQT